jgi:DNA polymerase kappa
MVICQPDAGEASSVSKPEVPDGPNGSSSSQEHRSLKHSLLGPSLSKAGQDGVNFRQVSEIIYEASKGSRFFTNEENKDKNLTVKINRILAKKRELERIEAQGGLKGEQKKADDCITESECSRDLSQVILHIDCDAFYASVEELDRPELKDLPFAVGVGVLTTCNYVARKYGCRSGMAGFVADKLCPQLIHLPLNFEKYTAKAKEVRAVLEQYDPRFESASIDEAYLNITRYCEDHNMDAEAVVQQMRQQVFEETKITVSAGIAANAKLAKICSNQNKPNGQFRLPADRSSIMAFMRDLPTRKVNGIGRVWERELDAIGVKTCGDIYTQRQYINRLFGEKAFKFLVSVYLGLGRTDVRPAEEFERKSVGTESTFHDISDFNELLQKLKRNANELEKDLERTQFKGRTLVLKIKLHTYEVFTRQVQPPKAVYTADDLYNYSLPMLQKLKKEMPDMKLRLMGLRCTHLVSTKKSTTDFFGRSRQAGELKGDSNRRIEVGEDGWQKWPDSEFEDAARQELQDEMDETLRLSQAYEESAKEEGECSNNADYQRYANGFAWRSLLETEAAAARTNEASSNDQVPERWDCPICSIAQPACEMTFNQHIDTCLSRRTIREIVQDPPQSLTSSIPTTNAGLNKKKRGRPTSSSTHKSSESSMTKKPKSAFFS